MNALPNGVSCPSRRRCLDGIGPPGEAKYRAAIRAHDHQERPQQGLNNEQDWVRSSAATHCGALAFYGRDAASRRGSSFRTPPHLMPCDRWIASSEMSSFRWPPDQSRTAFAMASRPTLKRARKRGGAHAPSDSAEADDPQSRRPCPAHAAVTGHPCPQRTSGPGCGCQCRQPCISGSSSSSAHRRVVAVRSRRANSGAIVVTVCMAGALVFGRAQSLRLQQRRPCQCDRRRSVARPSRRRHFSWHSPKWLA